VSKEARATGALALLAVDALFLGSLLFIRVTAERQYLERMRGFGAESPSWPDAGGAPGALLPWAAAAAAALAALLARRRSPVPPLIALAAAIACTAAVLLRMEAAFGTGPYGTFAWTLAFVWIGHLGGAAVALALRARVARFLALQAIYGAGLAALAYPA
jgi:hypothetical protein